VDTNGGDGDRAPDGVPALAELLGVSVPELHHAIGGPWDAGRAGPDLGFPVTTFTGLVNPHTPGRPLAAIRVDHTDLFLEVGHAVGVPLPTGEMQWALGEPRTGMSYDLDTPRETLLAEVRDALHRVVDAAVLRGATW
jgi:hypothetical protein